MGEVLVSTINEITSVFGSAQSGVVSNMNDGNNPGMNSLAGSAPGKGVDRSASQRNVIASLADGALIFYDVKNQRSNDRIEYWSNKLQEDIPYIIVGNKIDLLDDPTQIIDHISCYTNYNIVNIYLILLWYLYI